MHVPAVTTLVTFEDYLQQYAGRHAEWVNGEVIVMSPVTIRHEEQRMYLYTLLRAYFALRPLGRALGEPITMRLPAKPSGREPDIFVVLNTNPHPLREAYLDGPADICIEIVSRESQVRDRGEKFIEYQEGGVAEYWLIDSVRADALFYRLDADGVYQRCELTAEHESVTPLLPGLRLVVPTLWQAVLPDTLETADAVRRMIAESMNE